MTNNVNRQENNSFMVHSAQFLYSKLIKPRSKDPDQKRREFIFNILAISATILSGIALLIVALIQLRANKIVDESAVSVGEMSVIFLFFVILLFLSRRGFVKTSIIIFEGILFLEAVYTLYAWGVELSQGLIILAMVIVMAGILIGTRFAFVMTGLSGISILVLTYLQINHIIEPAQYWKDLMIRMSDAVLYVVTLSIIAIVAWLGNREIEKSLQRARASEAELRAQRDNLEEIVEDRTKELKQTQLEKMTQLYRFAEFGRLASGIFHDLVNPLTAVSLNIKRVQDDQKGKLDDAEKNLDQAFIATKKMKKFIEAIQRQLKNSNIKLKFSLPNEIDQSIQILDYKARKLKIKVKLNSSEDIIYFGDPVKFNQVITNLLANALDSYYKYDATKQEVVIKIYKDGLNVKINIQDWGVGIDDDNLSRIFNPFFTTKDKDNGMGIGLSVTKEIVEKHLQGTINVSSTKGEGTVFIVSFPLK